MSLPFYMDYNKNKGVISMKVKLLSSWWSESNLENKVNAFIEFTELNGFKIIEIQFQTSIYGYSAMITYT